MSDPIVGGEYSIATVNAMGDKLIFAVVKPSPWPKAGLAIRISNRVSRGPSEIALSEADFVNARGNVAIIQCATPDLFRRRKLWWSVESPLPGGDTCR